MPKWFTPELQRALLLGFIACSHYTWRLLVNQTVPEPYLDEVFHIPQAQAYWEGRWSHWDPKITTPPALYVFSYVVNYPRWLYNPAGFEHSPADLRLVNMILLYMLLVAMYAWAALGRREINEQSVLQREFTMVCFPLLFFFSGLYYTDILSTFAVMVTYSFWLAGSQAEGIGRLVHQILHVVSGLMSLASRQTNIFWVAVFLGGLQVIETLKQRVGETKIHDPPVADAYFEGQLVVSYYVSNESTVPDILSPDYPTTVISLVQHSLPVLPQLLLDLWPQLTLLVAFAGFVVWNGGVVLGLFHGLRWCLCTDQFAGDKSNHIASLHLPQMLYFFAMAIFFSWPVLLPHFNATLPAIRAKLPRPATILGFTLATLLIIHFNTLVHPFTLADNRHYPFYVFRYFIIPFPRKYLLAPVYVFCGWLAIVALGPIASTPMARISVDKKKETQASNTIVFQRADTVNVSFVLVFLMSTALSLITAPLVEPRYFLLPWLIWRLHVPEVLQSDAPKQRAIGDGKTQQPGALAGLVSALASNAALIELLWYMIVNCLAGYMFLKRPYEWPQDPGKMQRFMW